MYRNVSRNKDLTVSVRSRSRLVWLDSRKYVDDGRGGVIKSSPCKLKLHPELGLRGRTTAQGTRIQQDLGLLRESL